MFSYQLLLTYPADGIYDAVEFTVDPDAEAGSALVSLGTMNGGTVNWAGMNAAQTVGIFYKGLTRDDVGGLRYIYRTQNMNVENLPLNSVQAPLGASGNSIYDPRLPGAGSPGAGGGSVWGQPGGGTTGTGTNVTTTNVTNNPFPLVSQAVRPGVDKMTFVRVNYDSMVGQWNLLVNRFEDRVVTNSVMSKQTLDRTLAAPDIIFAAGDLGVFGNSGSPVLMARSIAMTSNDGINGSYALDGPGVITGSSTIIFSKIGPFKRNANDGSGEATGFDGASWGAFDDTTKPPIVFPQWASIADLEAQLLSGAHDYNPWTSPLVLGVTTQNNQQTGGTGTGGTDTGGTGGTGTGGGGGG
jgi:hypothetical protein